MFKSIEFSYNTTQLNQTYGDSEDLFTCKKQESKSKTQNEINKTIMWHNGMCIKTLKTYNNKLVCSRILGLYPKHKIS
jgi:hypothetical protein